MKSWVHDNYVEMYSAHNEGKSVVAEGIIYLSDLQACYCSIKTCAQ